MNRFKIISKNDITIDDNDCIDLRKYLKNNFAIQIDDKYYTKKIIKSGNYSFEIYDEIYTKKKSIRTLLDEINHKLDIILLNIKR